MVIEHFHTRDERQVVAGRACPYPRFFRDLRIAPMARDQSIEAIAEYLAQKFSDEVLIGLAYE